MAGALPGRHDAGGRTPIFIVLAIHVAFGYLVFEGLRYLRRWIHG